MGKSLHLGKKLKYPITITKFYKKPGDEIKKEDHIFQYTFTWFEEVGDPFGEKWQEKQTTPADWDSPVDGKILKWKIKEGMTLEGDTACMEVEESCEHHVQFAGLCVVCGKDMNETSWASDQKDADRAMINMIHDQTLLSVSQSEASRTEEQSQRRLLENRKLSLVVDLDQTIIHACIEPTVGEWQQDVNSPNHEAVKDVKAFQLADDGARGLANSCWYYIKMRPGLQDFLSHVAELYELHVYTMGTRAYAQNIAKLVDPEKKLFGDRIISRDENGSMTAKTLSRLFPVDTKMVVIIDDRADVWPKNRPNLIKVVPYDFFVGIGDINSSFLPKRQDIPPTTSPISNNLSSDGVEEPLNEEITDSSASLADVTNKTNGHQVQDGEAGGENAAADGNARMSALEELVTMSGADDPIVLQTQVAEQKHTLEKQIIDRPLLHMQQKLEREEEGSAEATDEANVDGQKSGDNEPDHGRHHLLKDNDQELIYLEAHLTNLHKTFYDEYDHALANAQGGRVAHLRPGAHKKVDLKDQKADLQIVPDIGVVMPGIKQQVLAGTVIVLSGLIPILVEVFRYKEFTQPYAPYLAVDLIDRVFPENDLSTNAIRCSAEIVQQTMSFGAEVQTKLSRNVTHLVVSANRTRTQKVRQALKYPHIKIVNQQWLIDSMSQWRKQDEMPYLVELPRKLQGSAGDATGPDAVPILSATSADESDGDSGEDEDDDSTDNGEDVESVEPEQEATSPIDDMKTFDWGSAEQELAEFMASGDDDDEESDTDSISSKTSQISNVSIRPAKHALDETDEEDRDTASHIAKKKRLARSRSTGLKTAKTLGSPGSESGLPTPDLTAEEEADDGDDIEGETHDGDDNAARDVDDDDLEAEMLAEFEKGDWDQAQEDGAAT